MALSNLQAGNSRGVDGTVKFQSSANSSIGVNGLVSGSNSAVQFTVYMDPRDFTCTLSGDNQKVLISTQGRYSNPTNNVYTVDTGIDLRRASGGTTALTVQVIPQGSSTGSTYTFTKSTGGGIEA